MRNLVTWNVVAAAVLGGICGPLAHLPVGRGAGRTTLKTIGIILLTGATTRYVAPALRSIAAPIFPGSRVERALEGFEARLAALPEWQERTRGRSRKEVLDIAHDPGFRGVARLDDESLTAATGLLASFIPDLDVPTCGGMVNGTLNEHACWAVRTMYHYLPQLPDEARLDLTRALFTS